MIRLIATDLDDTLLDANSRLTDRTVRALRRAMDAGAMVTLSSGRMTEAMVPFAEAIGVNAPMILYNGALIQDYRDGRTYFSHAIPLETARAVARAVEEMGIYLQAYPGRGYFCRKRTKYTDLYESSIRVPCGELGEKVSDWMSGDQVKLLAIAEPGIIDDAQARLRRLFPTGVCFAKSKPRYLEIVREGVDKGRAIEALARELGRPIVAHCEDESLLQKGWAVHNGDFARRHGLPGNNPESEWRQVERDLDLVRETGCRYHVCHISTKESVALIRTAKAEGLPVSCETAPHYLLLTDEDLQDDGRFRMNPLRRGPGRSAHGPAGRHHRLHRHGPRPPLRPGEGGRAAGQPQRHRGAGDRLPGPVHPAGGDRRGSPGDAAERPVRPAPAAVRPARRRAGGGCPGGYHRAGLKPAPRDRQRRLPLPGPGYPL